MQVVQVAASALAALLVLASTAHAAVTVEQGKKGLVISGDSAADLVSIEGLGAAGAIEVSVNLALVGSFVGVTGIKVKLGDGDDLLLLHAIHVGGLLSVDMGGGNDNMNFVSNDGNSFIAAGVDIKMGGQPGDRVTWFCLARITVGGDVSIAQSAELVMAGNGGSNLAEPSDIHIGGKLKIAKHLSVDNDGDGRTVEIRDVNVGQSSIFAFGAADDLVEISDSRFAGSVTVTLGSGDDDFDLHVANGGNEFDGPLTVQAGQGDDTFQGPLNVFSVPPNLSAFEHIFQ